MSTRPAVFALGALTVLVLVATPFLSLRLGTSDQGNDPPGSTTRQAYDMLAAGFGPGYNGPLLLVAEVDGSAQRSAFSSVVQAAVRRQV